MLFRIYTNADIRSQPAGISVIIRHFADPALLPVIHSLQGISGSLRASVLYFHEHQIAFVIADQVNLPLPAAEIFLHDPHTVLREISRSLRFPIRPCLSFIQMLPCLFIFALILSMESTNTSISATTSYSSGGIISPISSLDSVSASLSSR